MKNNKLILSDIIVVTLFSVFINLIFYSFFEAKRDVTPDTTYYLAIAKHLSQEFSYKDPSSPWPDAPSVGRAPLWPLVVSIFIRVFPDANSNALIRYVGLIFNVLNSIILYLLARKFYSNRKFCLAAAMLYSLHPTALFLAEQGLSEIIFVTLVILATLIFLNKGKSQLFAMFIWGLATLVRSNFVLFGPIFFAINLIFTRSFKIKQLILYVFVFSLPACLWIARNYNATGHFPIFSSIRGETFYGSHNHMTFYTLERFGYWIFPDLIPGETKKAELASKFNEIELDKYYFERGKVYLKEHISDFPRLIYGKITRSLIPIPWVADYKTAVVCLYRFLLYLVSFLSILQLIKQKDFEYLTILCSFFVCNIITILTFYGSMRFAFAFEPSLLPIALNIFLEKSSKS